MRHSILGKVRASEHTESIIIVFVLLESAIYLVVMSASTPWPTPGWGKKVFFARSQQQLLKTFVVRVVGHIYSSGDYEAM